MASFELDGLLAMDASDYVGGAEEAATASEDLADSTDETSESLIDIDSTGAAAGAALIGLGTAAQDTLDDTQQLRETLGRTSVSMGVSTEEANELARSMSNATFPVEDVVGSMDALAQIGVESEEEMRNVALAADTLADATGSSATEVAENLAPAVRALDGDLDAITEESDAFTEAVRGTGLEMNDLASTIERLDFEQLEQMGLSAADTAELIGRFGEESGFTGRQLRSEFRQAVEEADGDTQALVTELGLGEEAMASLADETAAGTQATDEYASAANESLSAADTLRSAFDDLKLATGGILQPLSAAAPAIQATGIAALTLSTINFSAVIPSLTGVVAAASPLLPLLIPLAAVVAGFGVAWEKGWIDPVETAAFVADEAGQVIDGLSARVMQAAQTVMRFYPPIQIAREVWEENLFGIRDTTESALGAVGDTIDWVIEKINAIPGVDIPTDEIEDEASSSVSDSGTDSPSVSDSATAAVPESQDIDDISGTTATSSGSPDSAVSGGASADDIAEAVESALSGLGLTLSGDLSVDGDVATMDDVDARLRREGRRARNRGIR